MASAPARQAWLVLGIALAAALFSTLVLRHLAYPLIWQDEAQTAALGSAVLEHGYPKVHGARNVAYDLALPIEAGVREDIDAYIASPWLQFYVGAIGVSLSRRADDRYERSALLRLPFAGIGLAGAWLPLASLLALAGGTRRRRLVVTLGYALGLCLSISLILHLREARYYAIAVLLLGAITHVVVRGRILGRTSAGRSDALLTVLLILLLHTLVPAFVAVAAALTLDALWTARERGTNARALMRALRPVALAGLVAVPSLWFYELSSVRDALGGDTSLPRLFRNLGLHGFYLIRYEFLAPALLFAALRIALGRGAANSVSPEPPDDAHLERAARWLWLLVACYVAIVARIPWYFSRYLIAVSPLVLVLALLEGLLLSRRLAGVSPGVRTVCTGLAWGAVAMSLAVRMPELAGRAGEMIEPPRGPLDAVIAHLIERHPDPSTLTIATNYEALVYDFYLGCRVIDTGVDPSPLEAEPPPDVVIRRRAWLRARKRLDDVLARHRYEAVALPVRDLPTNTIPELQRPPQPPATYHRFDVPPPRRPKDQLVVYHRLGE